MNNFFSNRLRSSHVSPLASHAFSLAEMLVVMLILTVVLAASMPLISKRAKINAPARGGAGQTMYIYASGANQSPPTCASSATGWSDAGYGVVALASNGNNIYARSCYNTTQTCSTMYIYASSTNQSPPTCASAATGWSDAGYGVIGTNSSGSSVNARSCYKCS